MRTSMAAMAVAFMLAGQAHAASSQCEANYKEEGGFLTGRSFTSWVVHPAKTPQDTFRTVQVGFVKAGFKVLNVDKDLMLLTAEQPTMAGNVATSLVFSVVVEPSGKGSKVSTTMKSPPGKALSAKAVKASVCSVVDDAGK